MTVEMAGVEPFESGVRCRPAWGPRIRSVGDPAPVVTRPDQPEDTEALHRMAALVEFSEDPVIGLTLEGRLTHWNPASERL